jgi:hypothetical protein
MEEWPTQLHATEQADRITKKLQSPSPSPPLPTLYSGKYVNKIDDFYWIAMAKAVFSEKKTIVTILDCGLEWDGEDQTDHSSEE